jgi:peroxiredoxin
MMLTVVAAAALLLALIPAIMFAFNLRHFRPPPAPDPAAMPRLSVLIPARNEEDTIGAAVASVLESRGVDLEVIVLDDGSEDATPEILAELAAQDPRLRVEQAPPLPPGWSGKQHACAALSRLASRPILVFMDADVRISADALARAARFLETSGADLVSGFPCERTHSLAEDMVIPLIHFILVGFLPMGWMRKSLHPRYSAGCGQLFVARREAYARAGGHEAIKASLHDGVALPRAFRRAGLRTDIFDASRIAVCWMYGGFARLWRGLAKNATEGLASPGRIVPFTMLLLGGQVMPVVLLAMAMAGVCGVLESGLAVAATLASYVPRLAAVWRFRQPLRGALLHPLGVMLLLAIQWHALVALLVGRPASWKGRTYRPERRGGAAEPSERSGGAAGRGRAGPVRVGDPLPDIALQTQTGEEVNLRHLVGPKSMVIFFYPKDGTPVCTAEACAFRDAYQDLRDLGAEVIGISKDGSRSHSEFAARHRLPFLLLSDTEGTARKRFGIKSALGLLPARTTYVVDRNGIVRHIFSSRFRAHRHVSEALEALASIAQEGRGPRDQPSGH